MKKYLLSLMLAVFISTPAGATNITWADKITGGSFPAVDANEVKVAVNSKMDANSATLLVGSCTVLPCLDGTIDGGDLIKLYGPGGFWTALQAGNSTANRSWRLPLAAAPGAGTTRLMNMDEYGQMGFVDPATFASALGANDNYVTDAEKTVVGNTSNTNTGDQTTAGALTLTATGFNGNLATTDDTVQEVAQKLDDLNITGAAHDAVTIGATANGLSLATQVLSLGLASTSTIGALSDADWDTFNNKVSYTPATPGAIGGTTPAAGTFTTLTYDTVQTSAADGGRFSEIPNTVTLTSTATLGRLAWLTDRFWLANGTNWTTRYLLDSSFIGSAVQAYDADLDDLADGSLTGSKVSGYAVTTKSTAADYTIGTTSANEVFGGTVYVTTAATVTAPAIATGQNFCVTTIGDIAVSLDVNASDKMILDGVALADGDKATNSSKAGDTICCQYYSADGQYCWSGTVLGGHWTDGN